MKKKFKKRYIIIPLLCTAIIGGSLTAALYKKKADAVAKVVPVSQTMQYFGDGMNGINVSGTLKKGSVQNIVVNSTLEVKKVNVNKGDIVKKGDTLLEYDTKSLHLNVEEVENKIKTLENEEKIANNELAVLKKLKPSEDAPQQPDEPPYDDYESDIDINSDTDSDGFVYEKQITKETKPLGGDGTAESPFTFAAGTDTVVKADYLEFLAGKQSTVTDTTADSDNGNDSDTDAGVQSAHFAMLNIYNQKGTFLFTWLIEGSKITDDDIADWKCSDGITIKDDGSLVVNDDKKAFANIVTYIPVDIQSDSDTDLSQFGFMTETPDFYNVPDYDYDPTDQIQMPSSGGKISENDNYVYSKDELKKMISDKENEIKKLGFNKKQAAIDLKTAQQKLKTGKEVAKMSGKVTFVAESKDKLDQNGSYIVIASDSGVSIAGQVDEFNLSKISIDMPVSVTNYADGSMYEGVITSISDSPVESSESYGMNNSSMSYYEFTVSLNEDVEVNEGNGVSIKDDDGVSITINTEAGTSPLCIELAFVREESGSYYVMVVNDDNVLEKRYVKVGRSYYGYGIDILSGLSEEDRIALPYGKNTEGMPVVDVEYNDLYGGLF